MRKDSKNVYKFIGKLNNDNHSAQLFAHNDSNRHKLPTRSQKRPVKSGGKILQK